mgnify:CR=1 FL=1
MFTNLILLCLLLAITLSSSYVSSRIGTPTDADVKKLQQQCEARRS